MSIELAINNVGEYFSAHYLADNNGFAKDIREKTQAWKDQGSQSSPRQLQALADNYFKAKARAIDYPEAELRSLADEPNISSWHPMVLQALGYQQEPFNMELLSEKQQIPVLLRLHRHSQPWLVIAEAPFCVTNGDWVEEPLEEMVQSSSDTIEELPTCIAPWEKAIGLVFRQEDAPRWLMLLAGSRIYLFDAHTYSQGRYLYIDLDEAYSRRDIASFNAIAALLSKSTLAPTSESEDVLHEKLREGSLKSTHGVSEQLQGAVREAIELICNGWVESRRNNNQGYRQLGDREEPMADGTRKVTAEQLKHDALVYVYRILFCLYGEARGGELGILPITDDVYRLGYSMEALRDLADLGQPGTLSENGTYYAEHLTTLFKLVHQGFHPEEDKKNKAISRNEVREESAGYHIGQGDMFGSVQSQLFDVEQKNIRESKQKTQLRTGTSKAFIIQPLTATLFDPAATALLDRVKLSNRVLQQVIRRLSLGTGSNNRQIGRINYAELGIVQLGSVYEGLLSYKGFFAEEDLIQVCKKPKKPKGKDQPTIKDNAISPKEPTWFVPVIREDEFEQGEIIVEHRNPEKSRIYKTGTFILHLNGVDRVNSASYYTPEVLTRALVKEALKERLKDFGPEQADEILELKICEPAMGSAAFLVEAIDQLGRHYLELKQEQLNQTIDPSEFEAELRRVRHYIAVRNVYGVDLNPVAVELGALSLWLASIHSLKVQEGENGSPDVYQPGQTPWFGLRLRAGNSLIGARRAVWTPGQLAAGKHYGKDAEAPRQLKPSEQRKPDEIYHFLVWDEDMAPAARDKLMKQYWPEECEAIKQWQSDQVKKSWTPEELAKGRDICAQIDVLWEDYAKYRIEGLSKTECTATVWPTHSGDSSALKPGPSLEYQEDLKANLEAQSGAFQRLKLLMDSWCSFYFWPLENAGNLPSRNAWLASAEVLLGCGSVEKSETRAMLDITMGDEINLESLFVESQQQLPDSAKLASVVPWYQVAREANEGQNFHHWELIFTEILGPLFEGQKDKPRGFDLMFGNPPWMKVAWNQGPLLSEFDPLLGVSGAASAELSKNRPRLLSNTDTLSEYRLEFCFAAGTQGFLGDQTLYPMTSGIKSNLYKKFFESSWVLLNKNGIAGFIHPEEMFSDSKGSNFRKEFYARAKKHYQLKNELQIFADVGHAFPFGISIFSSNVSDIDFYCIFNVLHPSTIEKSWRNIAVGYELPNIKNDDGSWDLDGHIDRVVRITGNEIELFASLFEDDCLDRGPKLPRVHSKKFLNLLILYSTFKLKLEALEGLNGTVMFDESASQKAGVITKFSDPSYQPESLDDLVISGPHYYHGNPYFSQPNIICKTKNAYSSIDLYSLPESFIPRSVFKPGDIDGDLSNFDSKLPRDDSGLSETKKYRYANREMVQSGNERSLIPIIIPPGPAHIITTYSMSFLSDVELVLYTAGNLSIVNDFFIKVSGTGHCYEGFLKKLPLYKGLCEEDLIVRALRLICLTNHYSNIFENAYPFHKRFEWASDDSRLKNEDEKIWGDIVEDWDYRSPLRNCFSRRQACIEIDVLVSIALGMSIDDLITIYKVQFAVMKLYEKVDQYDSKGRRLPNTTRKDSGAKELREELKNHDGVSPVTVTWDIDNGNETVTKTFYPPFTHVDRIEDYKTAYRVFSERLGLDNKEVADAG